MIHVRTLTVVMFIFFAHLQIHGATSLSVSTPGLQSTMPSDSLTKRTVSEIKTDDKKSIENKIKIIKREIDYKEYVTLAIGTMVFIAVLLTSVQTWNPTSQQ